ncbi:MAG: efflux RND transporter periplasmic adaptor subunit [Desulfuromonadales bacterium]|nr:efflux RND transporter periplasmic adaptor subunit [Desulfuromonadales bacterium]
MKKRILFAILGLLVVVAILGGIKALQIRGMINQGKKFVPPAETVTTALVTSDSWASDLTAVGTLSAVQGVTVSAELPGKVVKITFESGTTVKKGDLLVSQDTSSEEAQLPGLLAQVKLARTELERAARMVAEKIISPADYDRAVATHDQALAQANIVRATISKKTIRAPFSGRIGIRQVNLGQILREGDAIVTLQNLNPIHVDFSLPQQQLAQVRSGQGVRLTCDALAGERMEGRINAITPLVDADTRNVKVQATVTNRSEKLRPGMFVNVAVGLPERRNVQVIPATAVLYAPYSDSVFVVEDAKDPKGGKLLRQQFVRLGEKRGDFVAVTSGLKGSETIVSTGVFKLRNGQAAVINNKLAPAFSSSPTPENN